MSLFENFPYTNLHELNLDWLIKVLQELKNASVLSVNGQTGDVVLYQDPTVILPEIESANWSFFRTAGGEEHGIAFMGDGTAYIMKGSDIYRIYTSANLPDFDERYIQLSPLTDEQLSNWNIYRRVNSVASGIQFSSDGTAYIMSENNRYKIFSQKDIPPYPVTSVNGLTGDIILYQDNTVQLPAINDNTITFWNLFRHLNNGYYGIQFNQNGTIELITPNNRYNVYTANTPPPYPVTSVNDQTGAVVLSIPDAAFTDITDALLEINDEVSGYTWGLIRVTDNGTIGITFDNQNGGKAYLRYFDTVNDEYVTTQLLTREDIPSSAGVSSVNGQIGAVVLNGSNIPMSGQDNTPIEDNINDLLTNLNALENDLAIIVTGNTSTKNIKAGDYILLRESIISGCPDGVYIATANVSAGTSLGASDLSGSTTGNGALNALNSTVTQIDGNTTFTQVSSVNVSAGQTSQFQIVTSGWYILRIQFNEAGNAGDEAQIKIGNNLLLKIIASGTRWFQQEMWVSLKAGTVLTYVASNNMICGFEAVLTA